MAGDCLTREIPRPRSAAAVPVLIEALSDKRPEVRRDAADVLGDLGSGAKSAVPALLRLIGDSNEEVRASSMDALQNIDPEAAARAEER